MMVLGKLILPFAKYCKKQQLSIDILMSWMILLDKRLFKYQLCLNQAKCAKHLHNESRFFFQIFSNLFLEQPSDPIHPNSP
jgi:hypothetical protein